MSDEQRAGVRSEVNAAVKEHVYDLFTKDVAAHRKYLEDLLKVSASVVLIVLTVGGVIFGYSFLEIRSSALGSIEKFADEVDVHRAAATTMITNVTEEMTEDLKRLVEEFDPENAIGAVVEQKVTSVRALSAEQLAGLELVPKGTILAWSPPAGRVLGGVGPPGWEICNGENGTPDLTDRFLMGTKDINGAGRTGGQNSISMEGNHSHRLTNPTGRNEYDSGSARGDRKRTREAGGHNHGGENRPSYYTVVYIIRR